MHPADNGILDIAQRACQGRLCPPVNQPKRRLPAHATREQAAG